MKRPARARKNKRILNSNDPYNQNNFKSPYSQPDLSTPNSQYSPTNPKKRLGCVGCVVVAGVIVILCAVMAIFSSVIGAIQSHPLAIFFQGDFPYGIFGVGILIGVGCILCLVVLRRLGIWPRHKRAGLLFIVPLLLGSGAVLFWSLFINPNVGMTRTGFIRSSTVDITVGKTIYFRNPANGVMQILCVGRDQHCQSGQNDPSQLDNGLVIQPGQTVSVTFDTAGMYQITSKTTTHMNITISVNVPDTSPE